MRIVKRGKQEREQSMIKYAVAVGGDYDNESTEFFDTYDEAEEFAIFKAKKEKATVFIAEFINGCKNENYEEDEFEYSKYGDNGDLGELKTYICLLTNKITGKVEWRTDCLHLSIVHLKEFYRDFDHLELLRVWEAKEVELQ